MSTEVHQGEPWIVQGRHDLPYERAGKMVNSCQRLSRVKRAYVNGGASVYDGVPERHPL